MGPANNRLERDFCYAAASLKPLKQALNLRVNFIEMKVSNLQAVFLSLFIGMLGTGLTSFGIDIPGIILIIIAILGILSVFIFSIYRTKANAFPRDFIPWIIFKLKKNDPHIFPEISEKTLKKHISLRVKECPSNEVIKKITLFQGVVNHYQLIVEALTEDSRYTNVLMFWEQDIHVLFGKHFLEIFRNKPDLVHPYQKGTFWNDWGCIVVGLNYKLPETLVDRKSNWILFRS